MATQGNELKDTAGTMRTAVRSLKQDISDFKVRHVIFYPHINILQYMHILYIVVYTDWYIF